MTMVMRPEPGTPTAADRAWHAHIAERYPQERDLSRAHCEMRAHLRAQGITRPANDCVSRAGGLAAWFAAGGCGVRRCEECERNSDAVHAAHKRLSIENLAEYLRSTA